MSNVNFLSLPPELLIRTLSNLDAVALTRCSMTCRHIYETFKNSSLLKYMIELHFNGVTDFGNPSLTHSYPELIKRLQRRRHGWMSPKWTINITLEMEDYYHPYDLIGGAFTRRSASHLEIATLPTASNVNGHKTIKRELKNKSPTRIFTVDPTQDVIVLIEDDENPISLTDTRTYCIHIRTLSSDDPHPLAQQTLLQFIVVPNGEDNNIHDAHLEIARNTLVLRFFTAIAFRELRQLRVLVWDWTTSGLILDFSDSLKNPLLPSVRSGFGLFDSTYCFFTSSLDSGSIQLHKFARTCMSNVPATHHLATLHLPRTTLHVKISQIYTHAGPIEALPLPHSTPFMVNDDDRLHVFTINYFYADLDGGEFQPMYTNLFVHQRVFAKYWMQQKQQAHRGCEDTPLDIPWEEWGPSNTRIIFPSCSKPAWSRYVHGQRVVCPRFRSYNDLLSYTLGPTDSIVILDFSTATVLSAAGILPMLPLKSPLKRQPESLLPPSKISSSEVRLYKDDVETRLPCVSFSADLDQTYRSYMVYADGVIGVNADDDAETLFLDVYTI